MKIAMIGLGEVGYLYTVALQKCGFSLQLCAPRPTDKILKFSSENNIALYNNTGNWLNEVDVVISCVPGSQSQSVAKETIPFLKKQATFADFSSASSQDKKNASEIATAHHVYYADVVIMGGVDLTQEKTPLLCASLNPEIIIEVMKKLNTPIRLLANAKPGDAASLKLLRTIFMKGLSALTVECVTAAEYQGLKPLLYEILSDFDETPLSEFLDMLLKNHVLHACRQVHEIRDAKEQLNNIGFESQLLPAVEESFQISCDNIAPEKNNNLSTEAALQSLIKIRLKNHEE